MRDLSVAMARVLMKVPSSSFAPLTLNGANREPEERLSKEPLHEIAEHRGLDVGEKVADSVKLTAIRDALDRLLPRMMDTLSRLSRRGSVFGRSPAGLIGRCGVTPPRGKS